MSILNNLEMFTPTTKGTFIDPVTRLRNVFTDGLNKQIKMMDDGGVKGRRWWKQEGDDVYSCLRYCSTALDLGEGTHFRTSSLEHLKEVFTAIVQEVSDGGFDKRLADHWDKSSFNVKNKSKNKKKKK